MHACLYKLLCYRMDARQLLPQIPDSLLLTCQVSIVRLCVTTVDFATLYIGISREYWVMPPSLHGHETAATRYRTLLARIKTGSKPRHSTPNLWTLQVVWLAPISFSWFGCQTNGANGDVILLARFLSRTELDVGLNASTLVAISSILAIFLACRDQSNNFLFLLFTWVFCLQNIFTVIQLFLTPAFCVPLRHPMLTWLQAPSTVSFEIAHTVAWLTEVVNTKGWGQNPVVRPRLCPICDRTVALSYLSLARRSSIECRSVRARQRTTR